MADKLNDKNTADVQIVESELDKKMGGAFPDTPEEAKSDLQVLSMVSDFYADAYDYHTPFFDNLKKQWGYYDGSRQWIEKDMNGRDVDTKKALNDKGKPALTKNFIFPLINLISGLQAQMKFATKCLPRSKEDNLIADGQSEVLRWQWDGNKGDRKVSKAFFEGNITGRSWIGVEQVDEERDIFGSKTIITNVPADEIMYDRKSLDYDLSDADFLQREKLISRTLAKELWSHREVELSAYYSYLNTLVNANRTSMNRLSAMRKDIAILETWYRVYTNKSFMISADSGSFKDITETPREMIYQMLQADPLLDVITKKVRTMRLARTVGNTANGVLLDKQKSPYNDNYFPYVPYFAYRTRDLDHGVPYQLFDAQQEINKRDSQILHIINTMPKVRIVTDDAGLADSFEQGDEVIVAPKGSKWTLIPPPTFPAAPAAVKNENKDDMKKISGVSDDLKGIRGGQDSGVVVDARREQSMASIASLSDNLQQTVELVAKLQVSRTRQFMPEEKIARILGHEKALPDVIAAIKSKDVEDYDLSVTTTPSSPTMRYENFIKLEKLLGTIGAIPPELHDVYIDAIDIPQGDEIKAKLGLIDPATLQNPQADALKSAKPKPSGPDTRKTGGLK